MFILCVCVFFSVCVCIIIPFVIYTHIHYREIDADNRFEEKWLKTLIISRSLFCLSSLKTYLTMGKL